MASADEGAIALAGAVRVPASGVPGRALVEQALLQGSVAVAETRIRPGSRVAVALPAAPNAPGLYAYAVLLQAELNPQRRTTFVGRPFGVR